MNQIVVENITKRYLKNTLFTDVNFSINSGQSVAITGYNGTGKSTLLKIICGYVSPTSGRVDYLVNGLNVIPEHLYRHISLAAPYMDLIDDFTLLDNIKYYNRFKNFYQNIGFDELIEIAFLQGAENKQVKHFSSGMKQRLKLSLAILSDVPFLFLDEPLSNLDKRGIEWYYSMIEKYIRQRILIICTNNFTEEASFCQQQICVEDYRK